jgi:flagellar hook-basal body complex protein FliE
MQVTPIGYSPQPFDLTIKQPAAKPGNQFADALANSLQAINSQQTHSDDLATQIAAGKDVDVHDAVLASEEASLGFQYGLQIRNKLIDAYQEVMRMQV